MVYNTVQLYLVDGNHRLKQMHMQAIQDSFYLGVKLVRGAYMEKERKTAQKHGQIPVPFAPPKPKQT